MRQRKYSDGSLAFWYSMLGKPFAGDVAYNPYGERFSCGWITQGFAAVIHRLVLSPGSRWQQLA